MTQTRTIFLSYPVALAFLVSIVYWVYLAFNARMVIVYDSVGYELLGKMIADKGWIEFFKTGPNREPFYPALIALSMRIGSISGINYQFIIVVMQFLSLLLTQILALRIMRILNINNLIAAVTILYLGISPALVNSALSLYSEIATYPFMLAILILTYGSWRSFSGPMKGVIIQAVMTGLVFVAMLLNRAIFELVTPLFLAVSMVPVVLSGSRKLIVNSIAYLAVFSIVFYSSVYGYKSLNKIYNGHLTVTNRGAYLLYGNTALRTGPFNGEQLLVCSANIFGEKVGRRLFGEEKNNRWFGWDATAVGYAKIAELNKTGLSDDEINKNLVSLSLQKAARNPGAFMLYAAIEGMKIFFWESTQMGFVSYPARLAGLFNQAPLKNGLRFGISLVTLSAVLYLAVLVWRNRKDLLAEDEPFLFIYMCLSLIFFFTVSHSLFCIITRYALPIAPLFLILIALFFQKTLCARKG